jgi:hypothetical protein
MGFGAFCGYIVSIFSFGQHGEVATSTQVACAASAALLVLIVWTAYAWGCANGVMKEQDQALIDLRRQHPDWFDLQGNLIKPTSYDEQGRPVWP